jgi:hypothetical protein
MRMITAIAAKSLAKFLAKDFRQIFGSAQEDRAERLSSLARSTMECLGRTDALYHNLEHTMLVTLVGRDILRGRTLTERISSPASYTISAMSEVRSRAIRRPISLSTKAEEP